MAFFMSRFADPSHALLRIVVGFLFLWHGAQKLFSIPSPPPPDAPVFVLYVAGPIELVGGFLVMIGLFTRPAAFLCSGVMAVAYFVAHQPRGLLPIQNGGELAALYCWVFLFLSARGPGVWSVDETRGAR